MTSSTKGGQGAAGGQTMGLNEAFGLAVRHWREGKRAEAEHISRQIHAARPAHQGARHLNMALQHGVRGLVFTALGLSDPELTASATFPMACRRCFRTISRMSRRA